MSESEPLTSPMICAPWITVDEVAGCCAKVDFACDLEEVALAASEVLFVLTDRKYRGECEVTIRPCFVDCQCGCHSGSSVGCPRCCPPQVILHPAPAREVSEVKVDGVVLDPSEYRLDEGRFLVRLADSDGDRVYWPCVQRLDRADTEEDTFSVTYTWGRSVPLIGQTAAARLACELALACTPGKDAGDACRLPKRVTNLVRQGVAMTLLDPFDFLEEGKTGIYEVDLFIEMATRTSKAQVLSPDIPPHRRIG